MSYNGWKNYETWCVNLWMDNDYDELLEALVDEAGSVNNGADAIKSYVEQMQDEFTQTSGLFADLLNAALSEVDWREIAENHKPEEWGDADEAPEDDEEEEGFTITPGKPIIPGTPEYEALKASDKPVDFLLRNFKPLATDE